VLLNCINDYDNLYYIYGVISFEWHRQTYFKINVNTVNCVSVFNYMLNVFSIDSLFSFKDVMALLIFISNNNVNHDGDFDIHI